MVVKKQSNDDSEHPLVKENRILNIRIRLAQYFQTMMVAAFDALLHHGVNYRELPEYKDADLLDKALGNGVDVAQGEPALVKWIERVHSGIKAAIRRKQFRRLDS